MMEFFLSKVWAFLVGAVLMAALVQGVQVHSGGERDTALERVADGMEELFLSLGDAGPGLERVLNMEEYLSGSGVLTLRQDFFSLTDGDHEVFREMPDTKLLEEVGEATIERDSLMLHSCDIVQIHTDKDGMTATQLNRRTFPPGI